MASTEIVVIKILFIKRVQAQMNSLLNFPALHRRVNASASKLLQKIEKNITKLFYEASTTPTSKIDKYIKSGGEKGKGKRNYTSISMKNLHVQISN